ncbi:hypothetical protein RIR_jg16222.t1 [Rhizophagus irregularis DAOM 181602=DAOM 197198]|nr:hypothetical protein RIR_jg16222.t1 [Rhizophagus irregularis DAOM 181602=DAOM 197198]
MHFVILIIFGNIRVWILRGFCVDIVWIFGGYDNKSLSALWQSDVTNGLLKLGLDLQALANEQNGQDIIIFFFKGQIKSIENGHFLISSFTFNHVKFLHVNDHDYQLYVSFSCRSWNDHVALPSNHIKFLHVILEWT